MKYVMLVCRDAENMDAQTEPDPHDTPDEESFPWLDDLQARGSWITGDQLAPPRRAAPSASATGRRSSSTVRSPRPRRRSAGSASSSAAAWRRPSRSRPDTLSPRRARSRSGRFGGTDHARRLKGASGAPFSVGGAMLWGEPFANVP